MTDDAVAEAADRAVHELGGGFVMDPWTMARGVELGHTDGMCFYVAGRCGVLGDVGTDVVAAAIGWFHSDLVRALWEPGIAVAGARAVAGQFYDACAEWGRDRLGSVAVERLARLAELAGRLVDATPVSGLPLFAGWQAMPRASDPAGLAMQLIHVLRERRGALHLVASTAAGLPPAIAVALSDGPGMAAMFGWPDGSVDDLGSYADAHVEAAATTDRLSAAGYQRAFAGGEGAELLELLEVARTATAG